MSENKRNEKTDTEVKTTTLDSSDDFKRATLVWEMYKYRHDLCWRLVFRAIVAVLAVTVFPYANIELSKSLCNWLLVLPVLGVIIIIASVRRIRTELKMWENVKAKHLSLQTNLDLPETNEKDGNLKSFSNELMFYLMITGLVNVGNFFVILLAWVPHLEKG